MPNQRFKKIFLTAVEEGLSSLGDLPKQAIFSHLENSFKLRKDNIPKNLTEFAKALEKILGSGSSYLEKFIVKRLYDKLGLEFEETECWNFLKCIDTVRALSPLKRDV